MTTTGTPNAFLSRIMKEGMEYDIKKPDPRVVSKRRNQLKTKYGITPEQYEEMADHQANLCAICDLPETATYRGRVRRLAVDHDHATGATRALLCTSCNISLGGFKDDPELLRYAIEYLARF